MKHNHNWIRQSRISDADELRYGIQIVS